MDYFRGPAFNISASYAPYPRDSQPQQFVYPQTYSNDGCLPSDGYAHTSTASLDGHQWANPYNDIYQAPQPELRESFLEHVQPGNYLAIQAPIAQYPTHPINVSAFAQDSTAMSFQLSPMSSLPPSPTSLPGSSYGSPSGSVQSMGMVPHPYNPTQPPVPTPSDVPAQYSGPSGTHWSYADAQAFILHHEGAATKESNGHPSSPSASASATFDFAKLPLALRASFNPSSPAAESETASSAPSPPVSRRTRSRAPHAPYPTPSSSSSPLSSRDTSPGSPIRRAGRRHNLPAVDSTSAPLAHGSASGDVHRKCPRCSYVQKGKRMQDLRRHIKTHDKTRDWVCCGLPLDEAAQRSDLPAEVLQQTPREYGGLMMVGGCHENFSRKDALKRHLKSMKCYGNVKGRYLLGNRNGAR